jgi:hypothetical protein
MNWLTSFIAIKALIWGDIELVNSGLFCILSTGSILPD